MSQFFKDLDPDYKKQLEEALESVEAALSTEDTKLKSGDVNRLKAALSHLDQVTVPLAEHQLDQLLGDMVKTVPGAAELPKPDGQ